MSLLRFRRQFLYFSYNYRYLSNKSIKPVNNEDEKSPVKSKKEKIEVTIEPPKSRIEILEKVTKIMPPEDDYQKRHAKVMEETGAVKAKDLIHIELEWFNDEEKTKEKFLEKAESFKHTVTKNRMGQTEFVYAALRVMKDYGVHRDLQAYTALVDVFPKGVMVPTNFIQAGFWHYYKQQMAVVEIIYQMEGYRVTPDSEMERLIIDIFGKNSFAWRKIARNLYWTSKFINADPNPLPENLMDLEPLELAVIALKRMCPDLQTKVKAFSTAQVDGSLDKTWIASAQSPLQSELIGDIPQDQPLYIEGPLKVWLREHQITYFMLMADNKDAEKKSMEPEDPNDIAHIPLNFYAVPKKDALAKHKSIHIQDDGLILALGATGTSSRDSLLSWVRILEQLNPKLKNRRVVFKIQAPITQVEPHQDNSSPSGMDGGTYH